MNAPEAQPVISTADKAVGLYYAAVLATTALVVCVLRWLEAQP